MYFPHSSPEAKMRSSLKTLALVTIVSATIGGAVGFTAGIFFRVDQSANDVHPMVVEAMEKMKQRMELQDELIEAIQKNVELKSKIPEQFQENSELQNKLIKLMSAKIKDHDDLHKLAIKYAEESAAIMKKIEERVQKLEKAKEGK